MKLAGSYRLNVKKEIVWQALNNPDILKKCIPGCESFEKESDTLFYDIVILDLESENLYGKRVKITSLAKGRDYPLLKNSKKMRVYYFKEAKNLSEVSLSLLVKDRLKFETDLKIDFSKKIVDIYNMKSHLLMEACTYLKIREEKREAKTIVKRWWFDKKTGSLNDCQKGRYLGKL